MKNWNIWDFKTSADEWRKLTYEKVHYSRTPLIRTLVIRIANYPDLLGPSSRFVENSTELTCREITGYRIKYSTVLWLLELQVRRGRKVQTQVRTVHNNSRTSNCQCNLFSKKNLVIRIFCISGWLGVPINPDKWNSTVFVLTTLYYDVWRLEMSTSRHWSLPVV